LKNLALALLPAAIVCLIIFVFVTPINPVLATGLGFIPLALFNKISDALERREARQNLAADRPTADRPTVINSFAGFAISWPILLVYGALLLSGIVQASSYLGRFIATAIAATAAPDAWASKATEVYSVTSLLIVVPLMLTGGYLVGRWIGT